MQSTSINSKERSEQYAINSSDHVEHRCHQSVPQLEVSWQLLQ
jgi:hypothetical protein